ncbi:MAG: SCO6745 family protein [Frankia sp.]
MLEDNVARRMWRLFEPVHAVMYFAPECAAAFEDAGLRGFWRGYFAGRAAPLGPVGAGPVIGCFFGFAPTMVARALPDIWTRISPEKALAARLVGAREALNPLVAETQPADLAELAGLMRTAAEHATVAGRGLAAANAALPWPQDPLGSLWHATTILREHRGDGHVAALVTAGLDGVETAVWRVSMGGIGREDFQRVRGWSDDEWSAATDRLRARGWLDDADGPTETALLAFHSIEATTDRIASPVWNVLGPDAVEQCAAALAPIAKRAAGLLRWPNPIGVPDPRGPAARH